MIEVDKGNLINLILRADGDTSHHLSFLAFPLPLLLQTGVVLGWKQILNINSTYILRGCYIHAYIVPYKAKKKLICICSILKQNLSLTKGGFERLGFCDESCSCPSFFSPCIVLKLTLHTYLQQAMTSCKRLSVCTNLWQMERWVGDQMLCFDRGNNTAKLELFSHSDHKHNAVHVSVTCVHCKYVLRANRRCVL